MKFSSLFMFVTLVVGMLVSGNAFAADRAEDTCTTAECERKRKLESDLLQGQLDDRLNRAESTCDEKWKAFTSTKPPAGQGYVDAINCIDASKDAAGDMISTEFGEEEEEGERSNRGKASCENYVSSVSCKAENDGSLSDLKSDRRDAKDDHEDAEKEVQKQESELAKLEAELKEKQEKISEDIQEAYDSIEEKNEAIEENLKENLEKLTASKAELEAKVKENDSKLDQAYADLRIQFRTVETTQIASIDGIESTCRTEATKARKEIEANIRQIIKAEYSSPRNHSLQSLSGSTSTVKNKADEKIKLAYAQEYKLCMQNSQKKLEIYEKSRNDQIAAMKDRAALMEANRLQAYQTLQTKTTQDETKKQELIEKAKKNAEKVLKNYEKYVAKKQKESQAAIDKYNREYQLASKKFAAAQQKMTTAQFERTDAETRYSCAQKFGVSS
ncbi:MAG: hypothetical protein V4692_04615, partial [Bdellovibrionota bacterium]